MRSSRILLVAGVVACGLSACQSVPSPQPTVKPDAARAQKPFRDRKGWEVVVVEAGPGTAAHCRGYRVGSGVPALAINAGAEESGFTISVPADSGAAGSADRLLARFDTGENRGYDVRFESDVSVVARFPTERYDELLLPFVRARSVSLGMQRGAAIGTIDLEGSSWAINATDECRRMNMPK